MNAANVIKYIFMDGFNPNLLKLARACYKKVGTLTAE